MTEEELLTLTAAILMRGYEPTARSLENAARCAKRLHEQVERVAGKPLNLTPRQHQAIPATGQPDFPTQSDA